ncbi:MAG TPA: zinc-ribbon domain-containing protein, partial [Glycomyces sp.]
MDSCSSCGQRLTSGQRRCPQCGAPLPPPLGGFPAESGPYGASGSYAAPAPGSSAAPPPAYGAA